MDLILRSELFIDDFSRSFYPDDFQEVAI